VMMCTGMRSIKFLKRPFLGESPKELAPLEGGGGMKGYAARPVHRRAWPDQNCQCKTGHPHSETLASDEYPSPR